MLGGAATLIVLVVGGVGIAALVMAFCARLSGIENLSARNCVFAAAGFGLPLAAAATLLHDPGMAVPGLFVTVVAIILGVAIIRMAFQAKLGPALLTWIMNTCIWVLLSSLVIKLRG